MKRLVIIFVMFLGLYSYASAGRDRYGNEMREIARTSYTETTDVNVVIASAPCKITEIIFSGVNASTISLYDARFFTVNVTTKQKVAYVPMIGTQPSQTIAPVPLDVHFSSALMYNRQGVGPLIIKWEYIGSGFWPDQRD